MRRKIGLSAGLIALWLVALTLALPTSAAAWQHDQDDARRQSQDQGARDAQQMDQDRGYGMQRGDEGRRDPASEYGYQDGLTQGMHDRQSGRHARFDDQSSYKHADRGCDSRFGDHDRYRQSYRQAYEQGYDRGFNGNGYNQEDRVNDRGRHDRDKRDNDGKRDRDDRRDDDDHH